MTAGGIVSGSRNSEYLPVLQIKLFLPDIESLILGLQK